jgi:GNAT superfamily N-acetyltransferase
MRRIVPVSKVMPRFVDATRAWRQWRSGQRVIMYGMTHRPDAPLSFREACIADASLVAALVESAYRGDSSRQGWTTEADLLDGRRTDADEVAGLIASTDGAMLLAERDGELLACCYRERRGDEAYFGMFAVRPGQQGGGIGGAMLDEVERRARQDWGCQLMCMLVIDLRDELIAWYGRRGYRRTGVLSPFPYGDERFGVPRRDDLRFERMEKSLLGEVMA